MQGSSQRTQSGKPSNGTPEPFKKLLFYMAVCPLALIFYYLTRAADIITRTNLDPEEM